MSAAAGTAVAATSATSTATGGYGDTRGTGRSSTSGSRSRSSSIAQVRGGSPSASITFGCSSPAKPTGKSPTRSMAHRPGCHGGLSPAVIRSSTRAACPTSCAACDGVRPARLPPAAPPTARLPVTGQHHADVHRLGGQRGEDLGDLVVRRALVDPRLGHRELLAVRQHDLADGVEREVARPRATGCARACRAGRAAAWSSSSARSASSGLRTCDGVAAGVVGGQTERVPRRRTDERERQHLDVARLGQRDRHRAAAPLRRGEAPARGGGGQLRRDGVVALQPQHLLDEVGGLHQVGPPRRRRGDDLAAAVGARAELDRAAHLAQATHRRARRVGHARDPVGQVQRHPHRGGRRGGADVGATVGDRAAAVLDQQRGRPLGRDRRQLRVDRALEPARRLAGQLVPPCAARNRGRVEVRRLEEDVDRVAARPDLRATPHPSRPRARSGRSRR